MSGENIVSEEYIRTRRLWRDCDQVQKIMDEKYPGVAGVCWRATESVKAVVSTNNYNRLALHSPGLIDYDWMNYIHLSVLRLAPVAQSLINYGNQGDRVLDYGSYFGNFAILAAYLQFSVTAIDSYDSYHPAFAAEREVMTRLGVLVQDFNLWSPDGETKAPQYKIVLLMGVIEHIPHSPKKMLEDIYASLLPGGYLLIETPNLAYFHRRKTLASGNSIFPGIEIQFDCPPPFEGHHREYTREEVIWMLNRVGFKIVETSMYNFSVYGQSDLTLENYEILTETEDDETKREIIFVVAQK